MLTNVSVFPIMWGGGSGTVATTLDSRRHSLASIDLERKWSCTVGDICVLYGVCCDYKILSLSDGLCLQMVHG